MTKKRTQKKPDLEIIILTYNSEFWLKKTLTTLQNFYLATTKYRVQVTVVDNASVDNTAQLLTKEFSWVNYLQLGENLGFAVANNHALSKSTARFVMLLNSDMELTEHSKLDELVKYMTNHSKVGVISPRVEFSNGKLDPACHRGEPTPAASLYYFLGLESAFPDNQRFAQYHQWYKDLSSTHLVDAVSGAAMLVRRTALKKVGLLDERFFMYGEDLDWCRRFREAGYHVVFYPHVQIIHHKYKSGIKSGSQAIARNTKKHFYATMLQYYDKHYRHQYPEFVRTVLKVLITIKQGAL